MSLVNTYRKTRSNRNSRNSTQVFRPSEYENRYYESEHSTTSMDVAIRREDTRHGGQSQVVISTTGETGQTREYISLSLREARSLKAFLDRELSMKAR